MLSEALAHKRTRLKQGPNSSKPKRNGIFSWPISTVVVTTLVMTELLRVTAVEKVSALLEKAKLLFRRQPPDTMLRLPLKVKGSEYLIADILDFANF